MRFWEILEGYWQAKSLKEKGFWIIFFLFLLGIISNFLYFQKALMHYRELSAKEKYLLHLPKTQQSIATFPKVSLDFVSAEREKNYFDFSGKDSFNSFMQWLHELEQNSAFFVWEISLFPQSQTLNFSISLQQKPSSAQNRKIRTLVFEDSLFFATPEFALRMILNHRAKINNKWYMQGESIHGFSIQEITMHSLVLKDPQGFHFSLGL